MEMFDLLDNKRKISGKFIERGKPIPDSYYHQVVHICIFNKDGKLLVQKRHKSKNKWPNLWDLSCGGAVIKGEDPHQAAKRELFEELGIDYDFSKDKILMTLTYEKGFDDYFAIVFENLDIENLKLQKTEVEKVMWLELWEIEKLMDQKDFVPYYKEHIRLLFLLKNSKSYIR